MSPVVTYTVNGLYSAAVAGGGLLCHAAPRAAAVAAITAIGVSIADANAALDAPVDAPTWRATWTAAVSSQLTEIEADISSIADTGRAEKISERLGVAMAMLAEIHAQQAEANRLAADANKLAAAKLEYQRKRDAMLAEQERQRREQTEREAFQRQWGDVKVSRYSDGTIDVLKPVPGHRERWARIAQYKSVEEMPAHLRAKLK